MAVAPTSGGDRRTRHRYHPALLAVVGLVAVVAGLLALLLRPDSVERSSSFEGGLVGSGTSTAQTRDVPSFKSVELAGTNNVAIHVGGKQSVVVHADENLLPRITTEVHGDRLVIGNTGSFTTKSPMRVEITVPSLEAVALDGSGVIRASGTASKLDVTLGGSGDAELEQLAARDVHALVSGSGRIVVTATERLDAEVSGSGVIVYHGNPSHVTTRITGAGAINPR